MCDWFMCDKFLPVLCSILQDQTCSQILDKLYIFVKCGSQSYPSALLLSAKQQSTIWDNATLSGLAILEIL